jgi:hypothetical protein
VRFIYSRVKDLLDNLKQKFASDPEAVEYVETLERTNEEAFAEATKSLEVTAPTARRIKYAFAASRFFIIGGARSLQMSPALAQGGAPAAAAMALVLTDASVEFFNVAFTQRLQRWLSYFPLRFYSTPLRAQVSKFVNASLWNLVLFSVGRPMVMQTMAHVADESVPAPDLDSAVNLVGWSSIGVLFYTAFTNGYNTLRDKGWISASQIDLALQISGLFDLATGFLNSNPNWYFYRLFTWGPQWTFYALVGLLAKIAPVRRDRILAVESSIVDWQDVHEEQVTDASWHIEDEQHWNEALAKIRELEAKADRQACEDGLTAQPREAAE